MLTLPPFKAFLASNIPSVYDNTLSYYEELVKLIGYIEKVILPAIDKNTADIAGLNEKFQELKDYVDNYFKNLDVQEEINNKLDDMAESGQLATIIDQFVNLGVLFTYDTLDDLKAAENLIAGCTCQTLGEETLNDGYGAYYKIGVTGDIALDNGLYATLVDDFGSNNYYDEITVTNGREHDTDYYVATIPLNDNDGNMIPVYVHDETDNPVHNTLQYAESEYTTLSINGGLGRQDSHGTWQQGAVIANGVITHHDESDTPAYETWSYMGITADREFLDFPNTTEPEYMLGQGVMNAFLTFGRIVKNGAVDIDLPDPNDANPWTIIGVKSDKTIIVLTSDGRTAHDKNMTLAEVAGLMVTLGCTNAWKCDGGGSNSLVWKGSKQNRNIDENGTKERNIWVTLNVKKETVNKELGKAFSFIGKERQLLNKQIRDDMNAGFEAKRALVSYDSWSVGVNTCDGDSRIHVGLQHSFTHNNSRVNMPNGKVFENITDSDNRIIGFKMNKTGMFKITWVAQILCANTAGQRSISINSPFDTQFSQWCFTNQYLNPTGTNQIHVINSTFMLNNTTAGKEYYFAGYGLDGDDFNRNYITVEDLGFANT